VGQKEKLQKKLDFILEKLRFWRNIIFAVISSVVGIVFAVNQGKIELTNTLIIINIFGFLILLFSLNRLTSLTQEFNIYLDKLGEEE